MVEKKEIHKADILEWLEEVKDPEIPAISLIDLGVIKKVEIEEEKVIVEMTPTFVGCPAMDYMKADVERVLQEHKIDSFDVSVNFNEPWSSDNITARGRKALKDFGLAPPKQNVIIDDIDVLENVKCPYCDSEDTDLKSPFGPTLCRSLHYCNNCSQAFEQFKPL